MHWPWSFGGSGKDNIMLQKQFNTISRIIATTLAIFMALMIAMMATTMRYVRTLLDQPGIKPILQW